MKRIEGPHFVDPIEKVPLESEKESQEQPQVEEAESTEPELEVIDVESPELPEEVREQATEIGLSAMRSALKGIDDYVVFASTAMYLQGKKFDIAELQVLPGDFDAAVSDIKTLEEIRGRLQQLPGVEFENEGKFKRIGSDNAQVLAGRINLGVEVNGKMQAIGYPFEIFQGSRMVTPDVQKNSTEASGLRVLNLEGLQQQYLNNLKFEQAVGKSTSEVADFLLNDAVEDSVRGELKTALAKAETGEPHEVSPKLRGIMEGLSLSPDELEDFYEQVDAMRAEGEIDPQDLAVKTSRILAGFKIKIPKRLKNVSELQELRKTKI